MIWYHLVKMYRFVVACFLLLALKETQGQTTQVSQCLRSNATPPLNTYVKGCIEPPCILHQLENAVIDVVFEAPYILHSMTTKALPFLLGIAAPEYNLGSNGVTCNFFTNSYCPILQKEVVQYTLKMYIESFFPVGVPVTLEFRVDDQDNQAIWCIRVPIRIASPRQQAVMKSLT